MQPFMSRDTINVKLIRYLDDQLEAVPLGQVAQALSIDRNTVKTHIAELQTLIQQHFSTTDMTLTFSAQAGVQFQRRATVNLNQIMLLLTDESLMTKLVKSTFDGVLHSLGQFNDLNFVSDSTAKRHVKDLQSHLALFGLHYSPASHELVGDEAMVRLCYYRVYWETYSHFEWPFPQYSQTAIIDKIQNWLHARRIHLGKAAQLQLAYWWVIMTQRQRQGHQIELPQPVLEAQVQDQSIAQWMAPLAATGQEAVFLSYCWAFFCIHQQPVVLKVGQQVQAASRQTLQKLESLFGKGLNLAAAETMMTQLDLNHSYSLIFQTGGLILERDTLLQTLKQQRPWLVAELITLLNELQTTGNPAFQNQSYLLVTLVPLVLRYFDTSVLNPTLNIFLALDATSAYRVWLEKEIEAQLSAQYAVRFVARRADSDLVVSNLDMAVSQPLISINTPPNRRDWATLKTFRL